MQFFSNLNRIPWKYVMGMNVAVLALAISLTSINTVKQTTENRSQAKEVPYGTSPLPQIAIDPTRPPRLINPDITWGKIGDDLVVKGENLGTKPFGVLSLGNTVIPSAQLIEWSPTQIVFTIPTGATSGLVTLSVKTTTGQELHLSTSQSITITDQNRL